MKLAIFCYFAFGFGQFIGWSMFRLEMIRKEGWKIKAKRWWVWVLAGFIDSCLWPMVLWFYWRDYRSFNRSQKS